MDLDRIYKIFLENPIITSDSRNVPAGSIFFALKGANFNGNAFAVQALEQGAAYAVIDEKAYELNNRCILVEDVLNFLQLLANHHRRQLGIPVIGIVGSNGKTTTKELMAAVLQQKYRTLATPGNLNNHIGVPLTLLKLTREHEMAVIEMGANHLGENAALCEIAAPDYGLITNIGKDHLEGFGSLEGVAKASSELYYYLMQHGGTAFVNAHDEWLLRMAARLDKKKTYGTDAIGADYSCTLHQVRPHIEFSLAGGKQNIHSVLSGEYNFDNIMAAVAVGLHFGVSAEQIASAIAGYEPKNNRSQVIQRGGNTVYLDAYNANPSSMELSLRNFAANSFSNKIAILGDMFELGDYSDEEHHNMAKLASGLGLEELWLVGSNFASHAAAVGARSFASADEVKKHLAAIPGKGYNFFIKGSRGMKLETVLEAMPA